MSDQEILEKLLKWLDENASKQISDIAKFNGYGTKCTS